MFIQNSKTLDAFLLWKKMDQKKISALLSVSINSYGKTNNKNNDCYNINITLYYYYYYYKINENNNLE
jgi:hypothetical protein